MHAFVGMVSDFEQAHSGQVIVLVSTAAFMASIGLSRPRSG
jgi:hypothetical protein